MKEEVYSVTIAEVTIQFIFKNFTHISLPKITLVEFIKYLYKDYAVTKTQIDNKPDYYIEVIDSNELVTNQLKNIQLVEWYKQVSKNYFRTSYAVSIFHISLLVRSVILSELEKNKGFVLHASSILFKNRVYIFLGESGAGKSTIVSLLSTLGKPFTDDSILLRKHKNKFYAYQYPSTDKEICMPRYREKCIIEAVFFLGKKSTIKISRMTNTHLMSKKILSQLITTKDHQDKTIRNLIYFIKMNKNFYLFEFSKNAKEVGSYFQAFATSHYNARKNSHNHHSVQVLPHHQADPTNLSSVY